jgi:O-antigen ligase
MIILLRLMQSFLFLLPFQVALSPVSGIDLPFSRVFAPVLFLVYVAIRLLRRRAILQTSAEIALLGVYVFTSLLSVTWANDTAWALRRALFLVSFFPLVPVYAGLAAEYADTMLRLGRAFVGGAVLAALVGLFGFIAQFVVGVPVAFRFLTTSVLPRFLGNSFATSVTEYPSLLADIGGRTILRVSAFFPDPHMAAFYFGMSFPFAVALSVSHRTPRRRIWYGLAAGGILVADLLTFSRGGYVGLVFGSAIWVFAYVRDRRPGRTRNMRRLLFFGTVLLVGILMSPVRERTVSSLSMDDGSNQGRMEMYGTAVDMISAQPYGYGLGNYPIAVKPTAAYREPIYAHNLYLDIATECGVFGAVTFLLSIVVAFVKFVRSKSAMSIAGATSLAIFFGHSLFETPLYSVHILPVLLMILSLAPLGALSARITVPAAVPESL